MTTSAFQEERFCFMRRVWKAAVLKTQVIRFQTGHAILAVSKVEKYAHTGHEVYACMGEASARDHGAP